MASLQYKHYHDEEYDPCLAFATYIGADKDPSKEQLIEYPIKVLRDIFSSGLVKGDTLIELTTSSAHILILAAADYFDNIILLQPCESDEQEAQKWLNKEAGAIDHSHLTTFVCGLKGECTEWEEHEDKTRRAIKQIVRWDITKDNPLGDVVLPQADCVLSGGYLNAVSKDHEMYLKLLKQMSSLVKIGGHLILIGFINMTYYTIGQHKFSALPCDEEFVRKSLASCGFIIERSGKEKNRYNSDLFDYEYLAYFVSRKEREG
uniref:Nicotinamide N-methyltransferase n=1 Tax=Xenopus tropicalis TaxID=8364 RepID=A0A803J959_XENTR